MVVDIILSYKFNKKETKSIEYCGDYYKYIGFVIETGKDRTLSLYYHIYEDIGVKSFDNKNIVRIGIDKLTDEMTNTLIRTYERMSLLRYRSTEYKEVIEETYIQLLRSQKLKRILGEEL